MDTQSEQFVLRLLAFLKNEDVIIDREIMGGQHLFILPSGETVMVAYVKDYADAHSWQPAETKET